MGIPGAFAYHLAGANNIYCTPIKAAPNQRRGSDWDNILKPPTLPKGAEKFARTQGKQGNILLTA